MERAGRSGVPAGLRARLCLVAGPVDMGMDGAAVRVEFPAAGAGVERDGILMLAGDGRELTPDDVRELRLADQR